MSLSLSYQYLMERQNAVQTELLCSDLLWARKREIFWKELRARLLNAIPEVRLNYLYCLDIKYGPIWNIDLILTTSFQYIFTYQRASVCAKCLEKS